MMCELHVKKKYSIFDEAKGAVHMDWFREGTRNGLLSSANGMDVEPRRLK